MALCFSVFSTMLRGQIMKNLQLKIEESLDGYGLNIIITGLVIACRHKADLRKEQGYDDVADIWAQAADDLTNIGPYEL